ncbi:hypothetical protein MBM09_10425 [Flaviramulus sp. BrNp1-15]|uniref:hypothetical protein n=1 Tax=Flaviramulus sp. BrNp1-15 TaxID=2916754 RepID=UPI001EE923A4|nr:hypothetical protein [Flaviramulus sp. BrNp1-15]ULC58336.1 hypothetical protein MBM09_10425 [Flaviramulus sp. BrNp1-15]
MNKNKFRYILIMLFTIVIAVELFNFDYENGLQWKNALRLLSPVLMIIAMILSINHVKKHGEN